MMLWTARDLKSPSQLNHSIEVTAVTDDQMRETLKEALNDGKTVKQIVKVDERHKTPTSDPKARFLSSVSTKTDHETRAARIGKFQNVPAHTGNSRFFDLGTNPKDLEQNKRLSQKTGKTLAAEAMRNPASLGSATEDYLDNVAIGSETILNAAEYKFYGFYERIREKLSHRWNQELQRQFEAWFAQGRTVSGTRTTQLEVHMSPKGDVQAFRILGSSGIEALDQAAIVAFQKAGPYPNPPRALIEEGQGKVKVRWDFVVIADAQQGVRVDVIRQPSSL